MMSVGIKTTYDYFVFTNLLVLRRLNFLENKISVTIEKKKYYQ